MRTCIFILAGIALLGTHMRLNAVTVEQDVAYLGPDREEKLDVYLPDPLPADPIPAMVIIHGGGWAHGDKAKPRMQAIAQTLAEESYAVFSINYKLNIGTRDPETNKYTLSFLAWPQNFLDCKSALRYVRAHAEQYGVDPDRIGLLGASAGGHLAMLVAATANDAGMNQQGLYPEQSNDVSCIVNMYGVYDTEGKPLSPLMGATWEQKKAMGKESSPKTYFDEELPPMLILHGTKDKTVSVEESRSLTAYLDTLGTPYHYEEIVDAPHSFDLQPEQKDLRPVVLEFLQSNLK